MSPTTLAIGAGVALALAFGGKVAHDAYATREELRELLRQAAARLGIPAEWLYGLARTESNWNASATNLSGPDGARGGAWGLLQITLKTAKGYGYSGDGPGLLDPVKHIEVAERIIAAGRPQSVWDLAAWWNAGRRTLAELSLNHQTRAYAFKLEAATKKEA